MKAVYFTLLAGLLSSTLAHDNPCRRIGHHKRMLYAVYEVIDVFEPCPQNPTPGKNICTVTSTSVVPPPTSIIIVPTLPVSTPPVLSPTTTGVPIPPVALPTTTRHGTPSSTRHTIPCPTTHGASPNSHHSNSTPTSQHSISSPSSHHNNSPSTSHHSNTPCPTHHSSPSTHRSSPSSTHQNSPSSSHHGSSTQSQSMSSTQQQTTSVQPTNTCSAMCEENTTPPPAGRTCGETGIYIGEGTNKLLETGSAACVDACADSCARRSGCLSFGFSAPQATGQLGVCNLYQGTVGELQIMIVTVPPVGGQALQTFYDIACFHNCPAPVTSSAPPVVVVPTEPRVVDVPTSSVVVPSPPSISVPTQPGPILTPPGLFTPSVPVVVVPSQTVAIVPPGLTFEAIPTPD